MKSKTATGNAMLLKARALLGMDPNSKEVTKHLSKKSLKFLKSAHKHSNKSQKRKKPQVPTTKNLLSRSKSSDFTMKTNFLELHQSPLKKNLDNFAPSLRKKR